MSSSIASLLTLEWAEIRDTKQVDVNYDGLIQIVGVKLTSLEDFAVGVNLVDFDGVLYKLLSVHL